MIEKRYFMYLLLILFSLSPLSAEDSGMLYFWHLKTDNAEAWLTGSIHMLNENFYPLPEKIETAFNGADYLVVEVNTAEIDQRTMLALFREKGIFTDGTRIQDLLTEEQNRQLEEILLGMDLNPKMFQFYKPWFLSMVIPVYQMMEAGYDSDAGLDNWFMARASAQGKTILELETAEYQISIFSNMDMDLQISLLLETLEDSDLSIDFLSDMEYCWKTGDTDGMNDIINAGFDCESGAYLYDKTIRQRNIQMTGNIDSMLKAGGTYFIVVGAGHFAGEDSIVNLLLKKDYNVEQVSR